MKKKIHSAEEAIDALTLAIENDVAERIAEDGSLMLYPHDMRIRFHVEIRGGLEIEKYSTVTKLVRDMSDGGGWEDDKMLQLIKDLRSALAMAERDYAKHKAP